MIAIIVISVLFPAVFGFLQGIYIRHIGVKRQSLFHAVSLGGFIVTYAASVCYMIYVGQSLDFIWSYCVAMLLNKTFWFEGVLNLSMGQRWMYIGKRSFWDKVVRCDYTSKYDSWNSKIIVWLGRWVLYPINILVSMVWMIGFRIVAIVPAVFYTIKLFILHIDTLI